MKPGLPTVGPAIGRDDPDIREVAERIRAKETHRRKQQARDTLDAILGDVLPIVTRASVVEALVDGLEKRKLRIRPLT